MIESRKVFPLYLLVDLVLISICFLSAYFIRYKDAIIANGEFIYFKEYAFIFILWSIFIIISFNGKNLYATDRNITIPKEILKVILNISYTGVLMGTIIFFARYKFFSRQIFLVTFLQLCIFLSGWRTIKRITLRKMIKKGFHNIDILIVGTGEIGNIILDEIKINPWWGFRVIGFLDDLANEGINGIPLLGKLKDFTLIAKKYFIDEVIITMPLEKKSVGELIKQAKKLLLGIRITPEDFGQTGQAIGVSYLGTIPLLTYKERKHHPAELFLKRLFDFIVALLLIIILFPLAIIIMILIKIDSYGPVFYAQERAGLKGKVFKLYKFRSMTKDAEKLKPALLEKNEIRDGIIFKIRNDPRITDLGILLRKYSLDELPQLFNVLKGNMSLVGPRPPTLDEVEKYNHFHMDRLSIRPGITGLSQVRGRSDLTFRKWVRWDLWYINNWSFILDLKILLWTLPTVFKGKGAY